jgi:hypothetical protein
MFLLNVIDAFNSFGVRYALAGGYAVALHGAVRGTLDVDVVIVWTKQNFESCEKALQSIGLTSRLPVKAEEVFSFRKEYLEKRNLFAWSFVNSSNPAELVDVVLTDDLRNLKTKSVRVKGKAVEIISKRDLMAIKTRAGREQDKADVEALKKL